MSRRTIVTILGVVALLFAAVATTGFLVWRLATRTVEKELLTPKEEVVDLGSLVTQVRSLNRLETAAMRVSHISTTKQSYKLVPNALAGDELTFLAVGDVIAGIDMARLQPHDVWREPDGTVVLRLPPPEVLVTRVDNQASRVVNRKTGVLRRADVELETRARQHAEENIRKVAVQRGIVPLAGRNAEEKLAALVRSLGATKVRFISPREFPAPER